MKKCLLFITLFLSSFALAQTAGPILAFYGTSTSGKTSLIRELKKSYEKPIIELGLDIQIKELQLKNSSDRGDPKWETVFIEIFKRAAQHSRNGETVVLDLVPLHFEKFIVKDILHSTLKEEGVEEHLKTILVVCPFKQLAQRLHLRNQLAREQKKYDELRIGIFPFLQYAQIFNITEREQDAVDQLNYQDIVDAIDLLKPVGERSLIVQNLADTLGVYNANKAYLMQARSQYDYVWISEGQFSRNIFVKELTSYLQTPCAI